ncbi:doublesex- and mab-3-related transcription factor B1 [Ctenodactylus gundi]
MLRGPKCSRCRNHGFLVPLKGHAGKCRWKHCFCDKCYLITERQKIIAAQKMLKKQAAEAAEDDEDAVPVLRRILLGSGSVATPGPSLHQPPEAAAPLGSSLRPPPGLEGLGGAGASPEAFTTACYQGLPLHGRSSGPRALLPLFSSHGHTELPVRAAPSLSAHAVGCGEPPRPVLGPPFSDLGSPRNTSLDLVVGAEYLERELSQPGSSTVHSYRPIPLAVLNASLVAGSTPQRRFRHISSTNYQGECLIPESPRDFEPNYYQPPPPPTPPPAPAQPLQRPTLLHLPPGFLSGLHVLPQPPPPPPPPSFSLTIPSVSIDSRMVEMLQVPCDPSLRFSLENAD